MRVGRSLAVLPECIKGRLVCLTVSPGINHKSRVLYPSLGFLSSAAWLLMQKKQSDELIYRILEIKEIIKYYLYTASTLSFHLCLYR